MNVRSLYTKISLLLALSTIVIISGCTGQTSASVKISESFTIAEVIDGDTVKLENGQAIRLLGINSPEADEHYYKESGDRLAALVLWKNVKLESGPEDKDRYGRLLRYIFIGDTFVNLQMVKEGYATVYILNPDEKYYLEFKEAEKDAKEKKIGVWFSSGVQACIEIVEFNYNAVGNDNENLNGEYVTFQNNCDSAIKMDGWAVKDEATNTYTFKGFALGSNSKVTLYTGSGNNAGDKLYWNKKQYAVWNNDGDTLFLRDEKGNLVLNYKYP